MDKDIAKRSAGRCQQSQRHLDGTHAQCQHIIDRYVERGARFKGIFETLSDKEVVHAWCNNREQRLSEHTVGRQPGRFRLELVVAPHHSFIVETDHPKIELVEPPLCQDRCRVI